MTGPGFARLDGPPGPDAGPSPAFPAIRIIDLNGPPTEISLDKAAHDAWLSGGQTGDIYRTTDGGMYTLEIINGFPSLTLVGSLAGRPGPTGATGSPSAHTAASHKIPNPVEHVPGNYLELLNGPSLIRIPTAYP